MSLRLIEEHYCEFVFVSGVRFSPPHVILVVFQTEIAIDIADIQAAKNISSYFYGTQMQFTFHATLIAAIHFVLAQVSSILKLSFYSGRAIFAPMLNIC